MCLIILIDWLVQVWWLAGLRLWRVARSRHSSRLWGTEHWNGRQVWFFTRVQLCDNENNPIRLHSYQSYTMCTCAEYVLLLELPQSNRYYWMRWPPKKWQSSQIWGRVDCGNIIHAFPSFCWSSASRALPKSAMNLLKHDGLQLQPVLETGNEQKNHFCWFNNEKPKECYGHMRYSANRNITGWSSKVEVRGAQNFKHWIMALSSAVFRSC